MGGEKQRMADRASLPLGSPPHGRGKAAHLAEWRNEPGITPAWAGKRLFCGTGNGFFGDHPRMGGEKMLRALLEPNTPGSPPHGRGKAKELAARLLAKGITPAWAGKSEASDFRPLLWQDHPRMGGEKTKKIP